MPWVLDAFIDTVPLSPGCASASTPESGYSPLVTSRRGVVVYTSGVLQPGAPLAFGADFHSTFFGGYLASSDAPTWRRSAFRPTVLTQDHDGGSARGPPARARERPQRQTANGWSRPDIAGCRRQDRSPYCASQSSASYCWCGGRRAGRRIGLGLAAEAFVPSASFLRVSGNTAVPEIPPNS